MILPITWPITETYQCCSFVMSVVLPYDNIKNFYDNNYILLSCVDADQLEDIDLMFWDVSWEDLRKKGIMEMDLYHVANFQSNTLSDFIRERIDQGNYVLLHLIDEFYLPYSVCYEAEHYIHDAYIYGYEDEYFWVMAYSQGKLKSLKVAASDIESGIFSAAEREEDVFFCSLRPNHAVDVQVDYCQIKKMFESYLYGEKIIAEYLSSINNKDLIRIACDYSEFEEKCVYGIKIYEVLNRCLHTIIEQQDVDFDYISIKPFRILYEHKRVVYERISNILEHFGMSKEILLPFDDILTKSNRIFVLAIKYNMTREKNILERIVNYIDKLKEREVSLLENFLCEWGELFK